MAECFGDQALAALGSRIIVSSGAIMGTRNGVILWSHHMTMVGEVVLLCASHLLCCFFCALPECRSCFVISKRYNSFCLMQCVPRCDNSFFQLINTCAPMLPQQLQDAPGRTVDTRCTSGGIDHSFVNYLVYHNKLRSLGASIRIYAHAEGTVNRCVVALVAYCVYDIFEVVKVEIS